MRKKGSRAVAFIRQKLYGNGDIQEVRFRATLDRLIKPGMKILEIGAGHGGHFVYRYPGATIVGVDTVESHIRENMNLDIRVIADGRQLPFVDECFDGVFTHYVAEHVDDPEAFALNIHRVLKPGGFTAHLTPNKFHYVPAIARLTTTSFHKRFNRSRGRNPHDTFPTFYRLNSVSSFRKYFGRAGFHDVSYELIETPPNYLESVLPAYLAGVAYERLVNSSDLFATFRVNIICVLAKKL